ncbi:MAG: DctP family TRAP transporter solute-binding subunit [bacterium]|nr:DctP family TRAP transporter solute-binding subunit [bacterium]
MNLKAASLFVSIMTIAAVTTSCGGGDGAAGPKVFSLPHVLNTEHPVHKALVRFAEEVEKRSNGAMIIKIQPGGTLGNEQELCDNVSNDADAFTKISSTILETKAELAKVYSLPYLFRDEEHMWKVLDGAIGTELLDVALDQNLKGICYFDAGFRSFYAKKPIHSPDDLKGMKIRVQKSVMMQKLVETLGASPQQIAFSELYTAIDTGVVQGAENNVPSYYTTKHYKIAPYYVFDEHVAIPDILLMSARRWNALTPDEQKIIMDSAQAAKEFQKELWKSESARQIEAMQAEGVTFIHLDSKEAFVEATRPIYDEFAGTPVMEYVERIRAVE